MHVTDNIVTTTCFQTVFQIQSHIFMVQTMSVRILGLIPAKTFFRKSILSKIFDDTFVYIFSVLLVEVIQQEYETLSIMFISFMLIDPARKITIKYFS